MMIRNRLKTRFQIRTLPVVDLAFGVPTVRFCTLCSPEAATGAKPQPMLSNVDRNIHTCTTANRPRCITTLYNSRRGPLM
ncbi:hypothetical protein HanXRQr2_Chr04g0168971 [Helianthus annuus]|uniref:Uncharacterized protein n=1 Tax=Helianthus annuus TaxID=4232 RepID=A0A9K3J8J5_HELAN|nr:hypothetical protein HanXRQr2_Chr04g0168971 [Helianthus annuus]